MKDASGGSTTPPAAFRVGEWEVRRTHNRLDKEGETVQVEPKVMDVLVHLATEAPEVVSRDALLEAVWGSAHVSEDLPRRAVYELRKIFADDARRPSFIETIPRAGYRLVASVTWPESAAAPPVASVAAPSGEGSTEHRPSPGHRGRKLTGALAAVLFLLSLALSLFVLRGMRAPVAVEVRRTPLTSLPGVEYDPAFSPDGSRVAFLRVPDGAVGDRLTLHVQLLEGESSLQLSREAADLDHPIESPTWSPDGTRLAYLRWRVGAGWAIYEVPALGGAERKVLELGRLGASGLAWSPDGAWLALGLRVEQGGPRILHRVAVEAAARGEAVLEPLTDPPVGSLGDHLPAWSPDGKRIAFLRTLAEDASEVHVVDRQGGSSRPLLDRPHKLADLDWSADGDHLFLSIFDAGAHRIWSVEVATGIVKPLPGLGEGARWLSVSRSGERLVYGRSRFELGVWRLDLVGGEASPLPALSSTFFDQALDLSPDGERVAFASTRSGGFEVWISDLAGRHPLRLTDFGAAAVGHPRWRGDGAIVFHADPDGPFDLWTVDIDAAAPRRLTTSRANDRVPSVARDGAAIYFASDRSGDWQIWRLPGDEGPATQITRDGGYFGQESLDGAWLYYTRRQIPGLWRRPLGEAIEPGGVGPARADEQVVLADEPKPWEWGNWALAPEGIYAVTRGPSNRIFLTLFSDQTGAVLRRLPLPGTPVNPSLALASDAAAAYFAQLDRVESDLVLVEGELVR